MALTQYLQWDCRTSGDDTNGGAFDPVSGTPGTDYSAQDAAQVTFADLVIGGTTTQLTSAAHPFTSSHVGNLVNITGGTGFTTGRYQVMSIAGSTATMDRSVGTAASTGGAGKLGGGLATLPAAVAAILAGTASYNVLHVKSGTYTVTANLDLAALGGLQVIGFQATHRDGGTKPLITTATNSINLWRVGFAEYYFENLSLSHTAATRAGGIHSAHPNSSVGCSDCLFDGFDKAFDGNIADWFFGEIVLYNCEIKNCKWAIYNTGGSSNVSILGGSYIHDCGSGNVPAVYTAGQLYVNRTKIVNNVKQGIQGSGALTVLRLTNSTIANNGSDGVDAATNTIATTGLLVPRVVLINNLIYGNTGYGVNLPTYSNSVRMAYFPNRNNAYGANSTADRHNFSSGLSDVALTADPFTASGSGDYSLNSTVGGGASCKGAGY